MKAFLSMLLVCMLSFQSTEAWWGWGNPWALGVGYRPWGLGVGYRPWGLGLGYGGWGYGGLGYRPWGLGLPYGFYGRRDIQMPTEKVECYYMSEKAMITCNGGRVECQLTNQLDGLGINFDMFGVGLENNVLRLYAKNFTEPNFVSSVPMRDGGIVNLSIFQTGVQGKGLMINDGVCYNKIIELFRGIQTPVMVDGIGGGNVKSKLAISGFVLDI